jgi:hypothetical protein
LRLSIASSLAVTVKEAQLCSHLVTKCVAYLSELKPTSKTHSDPFLFITSSYLTNVIAFHKSNSSHQSISNSFFSPSGKDTPTKLADNVNNLSSTAWQAYQALKQCTEAAPTSDISSKLEEIKNSLEKDRQHQSASISLSPRSTRQTPNFFYLFDFVQHILSVGNLLRSSNR